jgi:hypothetical protein
MTHNDLALENCRDWLALINYIDFYVCLANYLYVKNIYL